MRVLAPPARSLALLAVLIAVGVPCGRAHAQEQPWLRDRRIGEGIGIRTGDLELHPGVATELGYDSNYFQRAGTAAEEIIPTLRFRLTPSLSLASLGPQRSASQGRAPTPPEVSFRATGAATYGELFALSGGHSAVEAARKQRYLSGALGLKADLRPGRPLGADVLADLRRIAEPSNSPEQEVAFDRDLVRVGAGVLWRPRGGVFDWRLGYDLRLNIFEGAQLRDLNNRHQFLQTRGRWRFLPRSALVYDGEIGEIHYTSPTNLVLKDSRPVRTRLGYQGLVTRRFGLLLLGGWGASFYRQSYAAPVEDFDSFIGHGELKWFVRPTPELPEDGAAVGLSSVAVGYLRDFTNSYLTDYYQRDRGYVSLSYFLGGVVILAVDGGLTHVSYPRSYFPTAVDLDPVDGVMDPIGIRKEAFSEERVDAQLFGEYRFGDRVGVNATARYTAALDKAPGEDDNRIPVTREGRYEDLSFARFELFFGGRWFL